MEMFLFRYEELNKNVPQFSDCDAIWFSTLSRRTEGFNLWLHEPEGFNFILIVNKYNV
jgi:hypothetical protein